jgi:hypothetical protein
LDKKQQGLAYLRGRAEGFRRGILTIANVEGGARMARRYGATDGEVAALLGPYGLHWDETEERVIDPGQGV